MNKRKIGIIAAVLLLLLVGAGWALHRSWANAQLEKVRRMQAEMAKLPADQRQQQWKQLQEERDKLTTEQRDKLSEERRAEWQRRMEKQIDAYFALPPEKRNDFLDKQIEEMEKRRKQWEDRQAQSGQNGQSQSGAGQGANAQGQGAGRQRGGGRNASPTAQSERRNQRLDTTSPEQRAKWSAYRSAVQARRLELGLPAFPGRGPGGR